MTAWLIFSRIAEVLLKGTSTDPGDCQVRPGGFNVLYLKEFQGKA